MKKMMKLLGYTYKMCNSGCNEEMIKKQCNAGDPLEPLGGLYRGVEDHLSRRTMGGVGWSNNMG